MKTNISEFQSTQSAPRYSRRIGSAVPMEVPVTRIPTEKSTMHSPSIGNPHNVPAPFYPGSKGYEREIEELKEVRALVNLGTWPSEFLSTGNPSASTGVAPELFYIAGVKPNDPVTAAQLVAMDDFTDVGILIFKQLVKLGVPFANEYPHFPFVEEYARFIAELGVHLQRTLKYAFEVKDYYGVERPQTVLELPGCVLCANDDGSPPHFAYIAGHAAVFGATEPLIARFFNFTAHDHIWDMVVDALWQGAMYRTLLGVHTRQDNEQGYVFGRSQEVKLTIDIDA